jgi:hypothetical protein
LDLTSFDAVNMIHLFAGAVLDGLPGAERLYDRIPPPLKEWEPGYYVVGYVTPTEAAEMLTTWPDPDHDDPPAEIYAAREQVEGWLQAAREANRTCIVFWE